MTSTTKTSDRANVIAVKSFIDILNKDVPIYKHIPYPFEEDIYDFPIQVGQVKNVVARFRSCCLTNHKKSRLTSCGCKRGALLTHKLTQYGTFTARDGKTYPLVKCDKGVPSMPEMHVYQDYDEENDKTVIYSPVDRNETAIRLNYNYGIIIYNGSLVIMNLDTGLFAAKTVCKRVSALSKNGKEKDPIDYFENDEGRAKALLLSEVTGKPLSELIYPDITNKINGIKSKAKAIDVNNDILYFGTLWLDLRFYIKLMQWANYTVDFDLVLYNSYDSGTPIESTTILHDVELNCLPMTRNHNICCMYVCTRGNEEDKCKMGISYQSYEDLRDEYIRMNPDAVYHFYRPIPNGEKVETLIKREYVNDRVKGPKVESEIFNISPIVMINKIKEYDPEWTKAVKLKRTEDYKLIDNKQFNLNRSDSLMKAFKTMKITNTTTTTTSKYVCSKKTKPVEIVISAVDNTCTVDDKEEDEVDKTLIEEITTQVQSETVIDKLPKGINIIIPPSSSVTIDPNKQGK